MSNIPPDEFDLFLSPKTNSEVRAMLKQHLQDMVLIRDIADEFITDKSKLSDPVRIVYDLVQQIDFLRNQSID